MAGMRVGVEAGNLCSPLGTSAESQRPVAPRDSKRHKRGTRDKSDGRKPSSLQYVPSHLRSGTIQERRQRGARPGPWQPRAAALVSGPGLRHSGPGPSPPCPVLLPPWGGWNKVRTGTGAAPGKMGVRCQLYVGKVWGAPRTLLGAGLGSDILENNPDSSHGEAAPPFKRIAGLQRGTEPALDSAWSCVAPLVQSDPWL